MTGAAALLALAMAAAPPDETAPGAIGSQSARHLIFLAENRPVFVRLRVRCESGPFEESWINSVRTLHACLDRNGDGTLTTKEADEKAVTALVRLATGGAATAAVGELDVQPKDGVISIDELAGGLRAVLGPFRLQVGRQPIGRTDALFDQLDRDKDGQLTRPELGAIAGSLRPLDLDDNEMISAGELEPIDIPANTALVNDSSERRGRFTGLPPVIELVAGESSLRPARLLLRKYDKGKDDVPGRPDNKLTAAELAIAPDAFAAADTNGDNALDLEELRKLLAKPPVDLTANVTFTPDTSDRARVRVEAEGGMSNGVQIRQLGEGEVELSIGQVRLDVQVQDGNAVSSEVRRTIERRFKAADVNKDGYLDGNEQARISTPPSPLAGLTEVIDRDGDGKIYWKELLQFAESQIEAARFRLAVTTYDQGRAIFGILDLDRDRRLGAREVMRTVDRVMSWDANGDGRVSADEIPYHFQLTIARGTLPGLTGEAVANLAQRAAGATGSTDRERGPVWFQKMDRNHDGDISRREFLGPRDQFDRLDRDNDGLIDPVEASAAVAAKPASVPPDRSRP